MELAARDDMFLALEDPCVGAIELERLYQPNSVINSGCVGAVGLLLREGAIADGYAIT